MKAVATVTKWTLTPKTFKPTSADGPTSWPKCKGATNFEVSEFDIEWPEGVALCDGAELSVEAKDGGGIALKLNGEEVSTSAGDFYKEYCDDVEVLGDFVPPQDESKPAGTPLATHTEDWTTQQPIDANNPPTTRRVGKLYEYTGVSAKDYKKGEWKFDGEEASFIGYGKTGQTLIVSTEPVTNTVTFNINAAIYGIGVGFSWPIVSDTESWALKKAEWLPSGPNNKAPAAKMYMQEVKYTRVPSYDTLTVTEYSVYYPPDITTYNKGSKLTTLGTVSEGPVPEYLRMCVCE